MKLTQTIILLIVVMSVFTQIQAKKVSVQKVKKANFIWKWLFGNNEQKQKNPEPQRDQSQVNIEVTSANGNVFKFSSQVKDAIIGEQNVGMLFEGYAQQTSVDLTGFTTEVLQVVPFEGKLIPIPVLDYRFLNDCVLTDSNVNNQDLTWKFYFSASGNEEYKISNDHVYGNNWKITMSLPNTNNDVAQTMKQAFIQNCQIRNNQMNSLKDAAIKAGTLYRNRDLAYANRQQTMEDQVKMGKAQEQLVEETRVQQSAQETLIKTTIEQNQAALDAQNALINEAATKKQTTEDEKRAFVVQLNDVSSQLNVLEQSQVSMSLLITQTKQQLNAALQLKSSQESKKSEIQQNQEDSAKKSQLKQQELASLLDEIRKRQAKVEQEARDEKARQAAQQAKLQTDLETASSHLTETQKKVSTILISIQIKSTQNSNMITKIEETKTLITKIRRNIEQTTTAAENINIQIIQYQKQLENRRKLNEQQQKENNQRLAQLEENEKRQLALVEKLSKEAKKTQEYFASQALVDVKTSLEDFQKACAAIVDASAPKAIVRTVIAERTVLSGGHVEQLTAVVSQTQYQMKQSLLRLAKQNKACKVLQEARLAQMKAVRLQRNSLKNKLKTHHKRHH